MREPPRRGPTRVESEMRDDLTTRPAWRGCQTWGTRRSLPCTCPQSGEHRASDSSPDSSRSSFPGRTPNVQSRRPDLSLGLHPPPSGPPPPPYPRHRPFGGPHSSCSSPGGHRSPALQTSLPPRGLRKLRLSWLRPEFSVLVRETPRRERQEEESDRRRWSLGSRRRRTPGARLSRVPPSSWPLCSS